MLNRHWHAWESCSADVWMVTVLRYRYHIPFHHLPPVALVSRELSLCALGSVRALALREEVVKMLQQGAVKPVDHPLLVERVTGAESPSSIFQRSTASSR